MSLGLHLIKNPKGTYSFVGSVPVQLAYVAKNGTLVDADHIESQMRLPSSYRSIKPRVWTTANEALLEATLLGFTVNNLEVSK